MIAHFPGRTIAGLYRALHHSELGTPVQRGRRAWSPEETNKLVAMCEKGASRQELFEKFPSRSHASILTKRANELSKPAASNNQDSLYARGRKAKAWTAEETALLFALAQQGLRKPQVAATLGRSLASVEARFRRIRRDGMETWPTANVWNSQDAELMRLRTDGYSVGEIAKILHRSHWSIRNRWKQIRPRSANGRPLAGTSSVPRLSDTDFSHIAYMRQSGNSWSAVQESRWPDRMDTQVRKAFHKACVQRITEAESRASPKEGQFEHNFSDADLARIERLREEGDSWEIVFTIVNAELKLSGFKKAAASRLEKFKVP